MINPPSIIVMDNIVLYHIYYISMNLIYVSIHIYKWTLRIPKTL